MAPPPPLPSHSFSPSCPPPFTPQSLPPVTSPLSTRLLSPSLPSQPLPFLFLPSLPPPLPSCPPYQRGDEVLKTEPFPSRMGVGVGVRGVALPPLAARDGFLTLMGSSLIWPSPPTHTHPDPPLSPYLPPHPTLEMKFEPFYFIFYFYCFFLRPPSSRPASPCYAQDNF